jgi:hypothetical protein
LLAIMKERDPNMEQSISERVSSTIGTSTDRVHVADSREGILLTWVESSLGVFEETVRASFGFLDDIRAETQERIGATLDWVEGFDRSTFRFARKALGRVNTVGSRVLSGGEQSWLVLIGAIRRTARGASGLATETAVSIIGDRRTTPYSVS